MKQLLRIVALSTYALISTTFLAACSQMGQSPTSPDAPVMTDWESHQQKLLTLNAFQVNGKLGYIAPEQRQSLNFTWTKSADSSELRLFSFLGGDVLTLTLTPRYARVVTAEGETFSHLDPAFLLKSLTGIDLPIHLFETWLVGLPGEGDPFELNALNLLGSTQTNQNGALWTVDYNRYTTSGDYQLPQLLKFAHQQTKLNVSIAQWQIR